MLAPATTANLGPGFDALGLALDWTEEVFLRLLPEGTAVEVVAPAGVAVPRDAGNLVVRGARAVLRASGRPEAGMRVWLRARLPVGRGLGSSAAAVAAGMVGANFALGHPLPPGRLVDLGTAIEGHPDNVAPAILGGFCVASRAVQPAAEVPVSSAGAEAAGAHAERAATLAVRLPVPPGLSAVAAVPDAPLDTQVARRALPRLVPFGDAVANVQRACLLVAAVASGRVDLLAEATRDRLHEPYRAPLVPGLLDCLAAARAAGALGAFLSGAGPTVLALVPAGGAAETHVAEAFAAVLARTGGGHVHLMALSPRGAVAQAAAGPPPAARE